MNIFVDACFESINKYNEELCGDKVEIVRNADSVVVVLADGLGSGVKANILATLTAKIIGTMLMNGASIDEAVETIMSTLPVCSERGIAYSTFSILQVYNSGEGYLAEFDNPSVFRLKDGLVVELDKIQREIAGKKIKECRFCVNPGDVFVLVSDGAIHAGVGQTLNFGWQWENIREYLEKSYKKDISCRDIVKLLLSACDNLYMHEPGDDTTVAAIKARAPVQVDIMVGPPVDKNMDSSVVQAFMSGKSKKVVCGGTTSHIVSRELGKELLTNLNYINPAVPPAAVIDSIDLTTEGVLTIGTALEYIKKYLSSESLLQKSLRLDRQDGASRLAKLLLEESTSVHFFVGRAMNPAHQNPELPLNLSLKLKLVEELGSCLKALGKTVVIDYF